MILIGKKNQSIFDVAFMCYGNYDVFRLISENSFIQDVNYSDFAGKTINYTPVKNNGSFVIGLTKKIINTGIANVTSFLKKEDGFYLLQENGYKIIIN